MTVAFAGRNQAETLVTSSVSGVTRPSKWAKGCRVPAYTRFAPLLKVMAHLSFALIALTVDQLLKLTG